MSINLQVTIGEVVDRFVILQIKTEKITDETSLFYVKKEMDMIYPLISEILEQHDYHRKCLHHVNTEIWDLNDKVRDPSYSKDEKYQYYVDIFKLNDCRFRIKSKFNKLGDSSLKEQKGYSNSNVVIAPHDDITIYEKYNHYIRYLSTYYNMVIVKCSAALLPRLQILFDGDPNITVVKETVHTSPSASASTISPFDELNQRFDPVSLDVVVSKYDNPEYNSTITETVDHKNMIHLPSVELPEILSRYDYNYISAKYLASKPLTYICGGKLGDFLHLLYVIMVNHEITGAQGHLYITNDPKLGGDSLGDLTKTYNSLYRIITYQPYIASFNILTDQQVTFDINLNDFRRSPLLHRTHWLSLLSQCFNIPLLIKPWIQLPPDCVNPKYQDKILIHRTDLYHERLTYTFLPELTKIVSSNKCLFITFNQRLYETFPLKDSVPMEQLNTLEEMFTAINSCKLFICNETSPLVMAFALHKPILAETAVPYTYSYKYYDGFFWVNHQHAVIDGIDKYLSPI